MPRNDLAKKLHHSLVEDAAVLWDTDQLENGYKCPPQCGVCGAKPGEGLILDSFVELARPLFAENGKVVYLYGRKLRCRNQGL